MFGKSILHKQTSIFPRTCMFVPSWSFSLVVLVFAVIMLDLFAKHLSVKLAEIVIQFSCAAELARFSYYKRLTPMTVAYSICKCLIQSAFFFVSPSCSLCFRRMTMGRLELLIMTPSLKMVSWVATNQYAARCPSWPRNCVNATRPPAQVSPPWLTRSFLSSLILYLSD